MKLKTLSSDKALFPASIKSGEERSMRGAFAVVDIAEEQFVIVNDATLTQHGANEFAGGSQAQTNDALQLILAAQPRLAGKICIASAYHVPA